MIFSVVYQEWPWFLDGVYSLTGAKRKEWRNGMIIRTYGMSEGIGYYRLIDHSPSPY